MGIALSLLAMLCFAANILFTRYAIARMPVEAGASVFHSTAPAFALVFAWLPAGERLGIYEIFLMAVVWVGLWFTQPHAASGRPGGAGMRMGMLIGVLTVAGFGLGSVLRGLAMHGWDEAIMGTLIASVASLTCQVAATRDWQAVREQIRAADRHTVWLCAGCGVSTSLGGIFMRHCPARNPVNA